jgi:very-short-patch-repair endonuclease
VDNIDQLEEKLKFCSYYLETFNNLPKRVQELLLVNNVIKKDYPTVFYDEIKSPIEQIFITAFELYMQIFNKEFIFLFPQYEIRIGKKKYIADFCFMCDENVNRFNTDKKIVIECDGHEFHQKTKEQVQHDNEREYDLKMSGYEIIRFSGSQIYNEPFKCAEDTYNYIMKFIKEE